MPNTPPPSLQLNSGASVLIAGTRVSQDQLRDQWETPDLQQLLVQARQQFGNALCCCRPAQLKLQIRMRAGKSHLAVWPEQGALHDSECAFFRDELLEQAAVAPQTPASPPPGPDTIAPQRIRLFMPRPGEQPPEGAQMVSVRALAYLLWEAASLCRWHPTWTRDWGRTRYQLLKAAEGYEINGRPGERVLFVPRVFRSEAAAALNREWEDFVREMMTASDGQQRVIIGQVRSFIPERDGQPGRVMLRHLRRPIGLHRACHDFISRECRNVLSNTSLAAADDRLNQPGPRRPDVVGIFSVEANSRAGVWARAGWLLPVHGGTYLPAANHDAVLLIDALVNARHAFQYLLSERQPSQRHASDWLVRHVLDPQGNPVARAALEILDPGSSQQFLQARAAIAHRMALQGIPTWTWVPRGTSGERQLPPLPPSDQLPQQIAHQALRALEQSPHAEYRYGPLRQLFNVRKTAA
ncbi:MAG: DUF1173 family protein [Frateuria sp.]|nr:DUF1173 family protein [Frateuria sp.]